MKKFMKFILLLGAVMVLQGPITASAHDTHGDHMDDARMKKLHAMMPVFSGASAALELAIDKGDAGAAKVQADRILAAIPDLKKSRPHKNVKEQKKFATLAAKLEENVVLTADHVKKGDFEGAKAAFKKVEEVCAVCHAKFRD